MKYVLPLLAIASFLVGRGYEASHSMAEYSKNVMDAYEAGKAVCEADK